MDAGQPGAGRSRADGRGRRAGARAARPRRVELLLRRRRADRTGARVVRERQADVRRVVHSGAGAPPVSDRARARRRRAGARLDGHAGRTPRLDADSPRGRLQGLRRRSSGPRPIAVSSGRGRSVPRAEPAARTDVGAVHAAQRGAARRERAAQAAQPVAGHGRARLPRSRSARRLAGRLVRAGGRVRRAAAGQAGAARTAERDAGPRAPAAAPPAPPAARRARRHGDAGGRSRQPAHGLASARRACCSTRSVRRSS